jgi:hypothetical protein
MRLRRRPLLLLLSVVSVGWWLLVRRGGGGAPTGLVGFQSEHVQADLVRDVCRLRAPVHRLVASPLPL